MYVCVCHGVTDSAIAQAAQEGACSLGELAQSLRVATCCGKCAELAQSLLKAADQAAPEAPAWLAGVT